MNFAELPIQLRDLIDFSLAKRTRIHPLLGDDGLKEVWIKREDELSAGIPGSKLRKYSSLIPYLKSKEASLVAVIGGPNSNNLVGLLQLLKENKISFHLFIREPGDHSLRGNSLLIQMLAGSEEITYVDRDRWNEVELIAEKHLQKKGVRNAIIIPEGGNHIGSLAGSMTLAYDVIRNEQEHSKRFNKIFIDSGTGMTAIGLILGLELLLDPQELKSREVIVTLIAGTMEEFSDLLESYRGDFEARYGIKMRRFISIDMIRPIISPKFGSTNQTLMQSSIRIARDHGILMDPTYSVKHFETMKYYLQKNEDSESLFIFNGSALGIAGFQDKIREHLCQ